MSKRTTLVIITIIVVGLLAVGGTVGIMALTHSGFMGGNGYGNGMMGNQQYQGTTTGGYQQGQATPPGSQTMHVTLSDNKVESSSTTFTAGMPYHFVVTNRGHVAHQFAMMPMGMDMGHMSVDQMHRSALFMYDSVAPGETRTFDYTFASSSAGQSFEFACGTQGQYGAGMQVPFMVNPHN